MFNFNAKTNDKQAIIDGLSAAQAVIEFTTNGEIITANQIFLNTLNYNSEEIIGKHHSLFCEKDYTNSQEYSKFWNDLSNGISQSGEFKRLGKNGKIVWLQASYLPIKNAKGETYKIVKFASDISLEKDQAIISKGSLEAIGRSQAVIEFNLDGTIITANNNFTSTLGYKLEEIVGKHHRIFCDPAYVNSVDYEKFWQDLRDGRFQADEFKRIGKNGNEIYIQASYNPIIDDSGKVVKIVKFATDITKQKQESIMSKGSMEAIGRSQAVIEFNLDGTIITANNNFTSALGYRLDEIVGKHHRIFCDPIYVNSVDYEKFWQDLREGRFQADEFKRFGKNGNEIYIQASYNPIIDETGKVIKIVKFATDITKQKQEAIDFKGKVEAIGRSQAVIEFNTDGTIITANNNFTSTLGYRLDEIVGKHHRIFCDPTYASSIDYERFWQDLRDGRFQADEFKRFGKNGNEIYIQASYNPIIDDTGKVVKVVKFATDVTETVTKRVRNEGLSKEINSSLGEVVNQVNTASEMSDKAAAASTETEAIVNSVAAAAEEMSQSVNEIAMNMNNARQKVEGAFEYTETANLAAVNLSKSAASMNNIVAIINEIAGNINLLALNATIESARAGEAGRGFAVVASEVKALASQVSTSTQTIASEINNMQTVSNEVTVSLNQISNSMNEVLGNVSSVASAIDQQNAVTLDISNNMQQAVLAVSDISQSLIEINDAFGNVTSTSNKVKNDVEELAA